MKTTLALSLRQIEAKATATLSSYRIHPLKLRQRPHQWRVSATLLLLPDFHRTLSLSLSLCHCSFPSSLSLSLSLSLALLFPHFTFPAYQTLPLTSITLSPSLSLSLFLSKKLSADFCSRHLRARMCVVRDRRISHLPFSMRSEAFLSSLRSFITVFLVLSCFYALSDRPCTDSDCLPGLD